MSRNVESRLLEERRSWRSITLGILFLAESDHGVDLGGAARRNVARKKRGEQKCGGDGADRGRVHGVDLVEKSLHHAADKVSTSEAHEQSKKSEHHSFLKYKTKYLIGAGAERDPQTNLVGALRHREGHHAVDADSGEQQCYPCKTRELHSGEAVSSQDR